MKRGYKKCPFCGEEIKEGAIKCRYCREFLEEDESKEKQKKTNSKKLNKVAQNRENKYYSFKKWGIILFIIGVIGLIGSLLIKAGIFDGIFENSYKSTETWDWGETDDEIVWDWGETDDENLDLDLDLDLDDDFSNSKNKNLFYDKIIAKAIVSGISFFLLGIIISIFRFLFKGNKPKSGFVYKNKSQYSNESLDDNNIGLEKTENIEVSNNTNQNNEDITRPWYKNIGSYMLIGFVLIGVIYTILRFNQKNAQNKINNMYDTIIQQSGDVSNIDFNDYFDAAKTAFNNKTADEYLGELQKIQNKYRKNIEVIGVLDFEENYELKDVSLLNEIISNWKAYKTANTQYGNDFSILNEKYMKQFGESEKTKLAISKFSDFISSMNKRSDVNIELYSYILSIQNDFYVNDNDEIKFYKKTNSFYKFNDLWKKREDEGEIINKAYSDFQNFYVEFLKDAERF